MIRKPLLSGVDHDFGRTEHNRITITNEANHIVWDSGEDGFFGLLQANPATQLGFKFHYHAGGEFLRFSDGDGNTVWELNVGSGDLDVYDPSTGTVSFSVDAGAQTANLAPRSSAPSSPSTGDVAYADGTNWDPGSGEGRYEYRSDGSWHKLGA